MKTKIALKNVLKHKWSSLILIAVFLISSFILYWSFGYTNLLGGLVIDSNRDSYGDLTFMTDFFQKEQVEQLLKKYSFHKVVYEREIRSILDNPQAPKKGGMVAVVELTAGNKIKLARYIKPKAGKLPEKTDEVAVSETYEKGKYQLGEVIYLTTSTPNKIINTKKYNIVGLTNSSGFKAYSNALMITEESMNELIYNPQYANLIYVFMDENLKSREEILSSYQNMKKLLTENNIEIKDSWNIYERYDKLKVFVDLFGSVKTLMLLVLFPLLGAVVAAIVWMDAFRRRKEVWTYLSLGMRNKSIIMLFIAEYWIIGLFGSVLGILLGGITSSLSQSANVWISFSYTFVSPLYTLTKIGDLAVILIFVFLSVTLWCIKPLKKLVNTTPFSY